MAGTIRTASREAWVDDGILVREIVSSLLGAAERRVRACSTAAACRPWSTRRYRPASSPMRSRPLGPDVLADTHQSGGGEDFSWYLEEVPGAMARLGCGRGSGPQLDLHQPTFDLDERALGGRRAAAGQRRRAVRTWSSPLPPRERACLHAGAPCQPYTRARSSVPSRSLVHNERLTPVGRGRESTTIVDVSNPELEQLLLRQGGVATAGQLMTCVTRRELAFHLRTGRLQKAWHGVYTSPGPKSPRPSGTHWTWRPERRWRPVSGRRPHFTASIRRTRAGCTSSTREAIRSALPTVSSSTAATRPPLIDARRQAGHHTGMDCHRGRQGAASASRTCHVGRRAA